MRLRKAVLGFTIALLSIATIAGVALVWLKHTARRTPAGRPELSRLDAAALPAFREVSNAHADATRVIVIFSPT